MNYTKNYRLPQWVKEDRIMMDDFNAMNNSIEAGLTRTAADASEAKSTANSAHDLATSAKQAAGNSYSPNNKPYVVGSYVGGSTVEVNVGFRPGAVIIFSSQYGSSTSEAAGRVVACGDLVTSEKVVITNTGFRLLSSDAVYPVVNHGGTQYQYIAFR